MSTVVDLRKTDDPRDAVHRAVHMLVEGGLVAFPTETVYAICAHALVPSAVEQLSRLQRKGNADHSVLFVKGVQEAIDYVPWMSKSAQRLARRCWPGPVTLAFDVESEAGLLAALPSETRAALTPDQRIWIRVPSHDCVHGAMRLMPAPLVALSEEIGNCSPPVTAQQIIAAAGDDVDLVIDDGECRYAQPSTVLRISDGSWTVLKQGVVTETIIRRLACEVFLFVCTGNTCRSPLAEGFFRKMLADRLKCAEDELSDHGYMIISAGLAAESGLPASPEGVEVARRHGVDLRAHESQPVTDRLLEQADHIITMTRSHKEAILGMHPRLADRVELLARDNSDIPDPIGAGEKEYEMCRTEIERNLRILLDKLPH